MVSFKVIKIYVQSQLIVAHGTKNLKTDLFLRQITNKHYTGVAGVNWSRYINANQTFD
jgi:hypothetical protein